MRSVDRTSSHRCWHATSKWRRAVSLALVYCRLWWTTHGPTLSSPWLWVVKTTMRKVKVSVYLYCFVVMKSWSFGWSWCGSLLLTDFVWSWQWFACTRPRILKSWSFGWSWCRILLLTVILYACDRVGIHPGPGSGNPEASCGVDAAGKLWWVCPQPVYLVPQAPCTGRGLQLAQDTVCFASPAQLHWQAAGRSEFLYL